MHHWFWSSCVLTNASLLEKPRTKSLRNTATQQSDLFYNSTVNTRSIQKNVRSRQACHLLLMWWKKEFPWDENSPQIIFFITFPLLHTEVIQVLLFKKLVTWQAAFNGLRKHQQRVTVPGMGMPELAVLGHISVLGARFKATKTQCYQSSLQVYWAYDVLLFHKCTMYCLMERDDRRSCGAPGQAATGTVCCCSLSSFDLQPVPSCSSERGQLETGPAIAQD